MGCPKLTYYPITDLRIIKGAKSLTQKKSVLNLYSCKEARYYDSDVARFLSLDPHSKKYPMLSPYNYVAGNPVAFVDPTGKDTEPTRWTENHIRLNETFGDANGFNESIINSPSWTSKGLVSIHQIANRFGIINSDRFKDGIGDKSEMKKADYALMILNEATTYADLPKFQNAESSYRHAMRTSGQSVEEAKALADKFVRQQYDIALKFWGDGEYKLALYNLGVALHTLQDATSPAHNGFQLWSGTESYVEQAAHVKQEVQYPGIDSNLQNVTTWFINQFYTQTPLPSENLFKYIKADK